MWVWINRTLVTQSIANCFVYSEGTTVLSWEYSGLEVKLTTHLHLVWRLRVRCRYTFLFLSALIAQTRTAAPLLLFLPLKLKARMHNKNTAHTYSSNSLLPTSQTGKEVFIFNFHATDFPQFQSYFKILFLLHYTGCLLPPLEHKWDIWIFKSRHALL